MKLYLTILSALLITMTVSGKGLEVSRIQEIQSVGEAYKVINKRKYAKTSSLYEYQYDNVRAKTSSGTHDEIILDLDNQVVGFTVVIYTDDKNFVYIDELINPKSEAIISAKPKGVSQSLLNDPRFQGYGQLLSLNGMDRGVFRLQSVTPVPNSDLVKIIPGKWKFTIAADNFPAEESNSFRVSVFVKKVRDKITSKTRGQLTFNLNSSEEAGVGTNKAEVIEFIEATDAIFKSIKFDLRFNEYNLLPPEMNKMCDSWGNPCAKTLLDLFKVSRTTDLIPGEMDVFFLARNNFSNFGIAPYGASVNSLFANKNDRFGAIIVWKDPGISAVKMAQLTFVHELGHYLGLYHTNLDNISDTFDYAHEFFGDQNPKMKTNIMNTSPNGKFTEGQKYVLQRAVVVDLYEPIP